MGGVRGGDYSRLESIQLSKKLVDRCRELVESFYFEPPDSEIIESFLHSDEEEVAGAASVTSSGKNVC